MQMNYKNSKIETVTNREAFTIDGGGAVRDFLDIFAETALGFADGLRDGWNHVF